MRISLFNMDEFVEVNKLKPITSAVLRGDRPHDQGLLSPTIFGTNITSRKETFAYINLNGPFLNPIIYIQMKRIYRRIEKIVNGEFYFSVNSKGEIVEDNENGDSGLEYLYNNWDKIKWNLTENDPTQKREIYTCLKTTPKNQIFITKTLVIPLFYRDITSTSSGREDSELNKLYSNIIRLSSLLKDSDMFGFQFFKTQFNIQEALVAIYDYFKNKIHGKNGLIRRYLMAKNPDYTTRVVITAPNFHSETPEELSTDIGHSCMPISICCSSLMPFFERWLKLFFERNVMDNKTGMEVYNPVTDKIVSGEKPKNPEAYFSTDNIKKSIVKYISDPSSRFDPVEVPVESGRKSYLVFTGTRGDSTNTSEVSSIAYRPLTWTDLLYVAAVDITKDKHNITTRYPISDEFGIFISAIRVSSTVITDVMQVGGKVYNWYPHVEYGIPKSQVASKFIDSMQFSNSYLEGLGGDYDGDQITNKTVWTKEANEECEKQLTQKSYFINIEGKMIRTTGAEAIQTLYTLTKEADTTIRPVDSESKKILLALKPTEITFSKLVDWLAVTRDTETGVMHAAKYSPRTPMTLEAGEYFNKEKVNTTFGKFLYNKIVVERCGFQNVLGYVQDTITNGVNSSIEAKLSTALQNDKIDVPQMYRYINTRDWLGLQCHALITSSFTPGTIKVPKEVIKLKKKLIAENKEALDNGDEIVSEQIENQLLAKTKELLKDDVGLDLYMSGARGSFNNNFKNMYLMRGAVKDPATEKFDIVTNSLVDGLDKKDIAVHSNTILGGAYAKGVATADSGYLGKQIMQLMQNEVLGPDNSDCGTTKTISVLLTSKNANRYTDRYIIDRGKLVRLTPDAMTKYIGKVVKMRSPQYCIYKNGAAICEKCAGHQGYTLDKQAIGLTGFRIGTVCVNLGMKKFHDATVHVNKLNVDELLV